MTPIGPTFRPDPTTTLAAVSKRLRRFKVVYKRGRAHVHSPDLEYDQKMAAITAAREEAKHNPQEVVFLYEALR